MNELISLIFIGILFERIIIIIAASVCIYFGWRAFLYTNDNQGKPASNSNSEAIIKLQGISFAFKRIGVGVIFSAFGASILIYALAKPITFEINSNNLKSLKDLTLADTAQNPANPDTTIKVIGLGSSDISESLEQIHALNIAIRVAKNDITDPKVQNALNAQLQKVSNSLIKLRDRLVSNNIGLKKFNLWRENGVDYLQDVNRVPENIRNQLEDISKWFDDSASDN